MLLRIEIWFFVYYFSANEVQANCSIDLATFSRNEPLFMIKIDEQQKKIDEQQKKFELAPSKNGVITIPEGGKISFSCANANSELV